MSSLEAGFEGDLEHVGPAPADGRASSPAGGAQHIHAPSSAVQRRYAIKRLGGLLFRSLMTVIFTPKLNVLLPSGPGAILVHALWGNQGMVFVLSLLGIVPLAERIGYVTEQLAFFTGETDTTALAGVETFVQSDTTTLAVIKQVRAMWKKLQQIDILEVKQSNGRILDDQQIAKLQTKHLLESTLADLGFPVETELKGSLSDVPDGKGSKKTGASRKQRRKSKQKELVVEILLVKHETCLEKISFKGFPDNKDAQLSEEKKNKRAEITLLQALLCWT